MITPNKCLMLLYSISHCNTSKLLTIILTQIDKTIYNCIKK
jgi:hypothetical protein